MSSAQLSQAYLDGGDRLLVSLLLAAGLHALIILGISFAPESAPPEERQPPALDITLVPKLDTPPPKEADYLAQISQDGGGNTTEKVRPQLEQQARQASAAPAEPVPAQTQELSRADAERASAATPEAKPIPEPPKPVTAAELINRSMELASLDAQLRQAREAYSKLPRQTFISARSQEFRHASYMNDWVLKVERVGNLNYPDQARRQGISGSLMLQVSINTDGSVRNIRLLRSSGHKVLDDAAIRIVQLAAPFAPLPPEIRKDTDILHITRTWEFLNNQGLSTRR